LLVLLALDGVTKVRFANDQMRVKVLAKSGHTDINLIELPEAMTKLDAVKFIKNLDEFSNVVEQVAIADYLDRKDEKPAKVAAPKVKATAAKAPAKTKAAPKVKAVATEGMDENIPF
jgi:hypothetical protein